MALEKHTHSIYSNAVGEVARSAPTAPHILDEVGQVAEALLQRLQVNESRLYEVRDRLLGKNETPKTATSVSPTLYGQIGEIYATLIKCQAALEEMGFIITDLEKL